MHGSPRNLEFSAPFLLVPVLLAALLLAGCGSEDTGTATPQDEGSVSPSSTPSEAPPSTEATDEVTDEGPDTRGWPKCEKVWIAGDDLPRTYVGCTEGDEAVKAERVPCSMGVKLVVYNDRFWAATGNRISESDGPLRKNPEFRQVRNTCSA